MSAEEAPWDETTTRADSLSRVGELNRDVMECGNPEDVWRETIKHFRWRAGVERGIAHDLREIAEASAEDAAIHAERAHEFTHLADAMERAPVTFPASADTRPEGGDSTEIEAPFTGGAVPHEDAADAQPTPVSDPISNKGR